MRRKVPFDVISSEPESRVNGQTRKTYMKSRESIWLSEYEGLLPIADGDRLPRHDAEAPVLPEYQAVSPHFELTSVDLEKTTPIAFFE